MKLFNFLIGFFLTTSSLSAMDQSNVADSDEEYDRQDSNTRDSSQPILSGNQDNENLSSSNNLEKALVTAGIALAAAVVQGSYNACVAILSRKTQNNQTSNVLEMRNEVPLEDDFVFIGEIPQRVNPIDVRRLNNLHNALGQGNIQEAERVLRNSGGSDNDED